MVINSRNATEALTAGTPKVIAEERSVNKRLTLEISNLNALGGDDVFISVGEEAAANKGRRCQAGQTITWTADSGYIPPQGRVMAYSAANTNLAIYEEIEV